MVGYHIISLLFLQLSFGIMRRREGRYGKQFIFFIYFLVTFLNQCSVICIRSEWMVFQLVLGAESGSAFI
jgi:hypothetical protein